ncbi:hypothetical protein [Streptomyces laculatispora]|uniref:hypothetical protein n=1 Tax=Streptomyces laculatispora TaxID=887464 RepID=UPI001A949A46|nr:hypothetical protein [Streptomyces laculatispora]MBO0917511.1 hypothetical protein [Streptomyces laculatispora]
MDVNGIVAEQVAAARVRIQAAKRRREEMSAARRRGLAARHANKLRNLRESEARAAVGQQPTTVTDTVTDTTEKEN